MHKSALSEVFYESIHSIVTKYGHLVTKFRILLMKRRASVYAEAVHFSGGMMTNFVGFIDGNKIRIARPSGNMYQKSVYSGHKRIHCLSYQTIATPGGLIFHIYGRIEGSTVDCVAQADIPVTDEFGCRVVYID